MHARYLGRDLRAGIVVFLVAIPLCLGIAIASGAPPVAGLITGIVGGVVVSWASGSPLSVSGPAAGLTAIVLQVINEFGYPGLLLATVLAGLIQIGLGYARMGIIGAFVPSGVIKGMLAGIGLILIGTQIPLAIGHAPGSDAKLTQPGSLLDGITPLAVGITLLCLAILIFFETPFAKRFPKLAIIPPPLLAVLAGAGISMLVQSTNPGLALAANQHVSLPGLDGPASLLGAITFPDFYQLTEIGIYVAAITLALVASLETLLCVEAVDELDPLGRKSPTHRELGAQGVGNVVSGMIGGLPMTSVIVRSSANVQAGGRTRIASFVHGLLLFGSVAFAAFALEAIPLAALAAVLLFTGYKLARPAIIASQWHAGKRRFLPFAATIIAILATDLLIGVITGIVVALYFLMRAHYKSAISMTMDGSHGLLRFNSEVSFLNRQLLRSYLTRVPEGGHIVIDASAAHFIDPDVIEDIDHFVAGAPERNIGCEVHGLERHLVVANG